MKIKVVIEHDEDGIFVVTVPSLPGCISQGQTESEAIDNIKEAIELHLETIPDEGKLAQLTSAKLKIVEVTV